MTLTFPNSYFDRYFDLIGADQWLRDHIFDAYSQPHRHYHTIDHIALMLNNIRNFNPMDVGPAMTYACFMHDIVYDVDHHDSEELSALVAQAYGGRTSLNKEQIDLSTELILATKNHTIYNTSNSATVRNFIEADLSIFNESHPIYYWYAAGIRKEYAHIPLKDYCHGRIGILDKMLDLPFISDYNIEWEIGHLERYQEII